MSLVVQISDLEKSYGETKVLKGLNIEIPQGKIFGLIGPNGAGKSTLIGVLTGLLNYESGEIRIFDMEFNKKNEQVIKEKISSVLQPPLLFEAFTSHEFLDYVCDVYQQDEEGREVHWAHYWGDGQPGEQLCSGKAYVHAISTSLAAHGAF